MFVGKDGVILTVTRAGLIAQHFGTGAHLMKLRIITFLMLVMVSKSAPNSLAGDVFFQFNYDASFDINAGANSAAAKSDFTYVANYLTSVLDSGVSGNVTVEVDVSGIYNASTGTLAYAGSSLYLTNNFEPVFTQSHIQTGVKTWVGSDAGATVNFAQSLGYGGNVSSSQYDFRYILLHEMTHALGFVGLIGSTGASSNPTTYSTFDSYLLGWNGSSYQNLVSRDGTGTPTGSMAGASAALINSAHPILFNGPNVTAYLGQAAQMFTPGSYLSGSSTYHTNYSNSLMYYSVSPGNKPFGYSGLDIAFMKDLGYTVTVPEPGSMGLAVVSLVVLVVGQTRRRGVI